MNRNKATGISLALAAGLALAGCGSAASHATTGRPVSAVDVATDKAVMADACHSYTHNVGTIVEMGMIEPFRIGKLLARLEAVANHGTGPDHNAVAKAFGAASLDYFLNGTHAHSVRDLTVIATACYNAEH